MLLEIAASGGVLCLTFALVVEALRRRLYTLGRITHVLFVVFLVVRIAISYRVIWLLNRILLLLICSVVLRDPLRGVNFRYLSIGFHFMHSCGFLLD